MSKIIVRNDNPNPKYVKKRIIAQKVLGISLAVMLCSSFSSLAIGQSINNDVRDLKNEQDKIYEAFEDSAEFEAEFKQDFKALSNDYVNGIITYDQFEEGLTQIQSQEYIKQVFDQKANRDMTAQIQQLDDQITDVKQNSKRAKANSILEVPFLAGFATIMASIIPYAIYESKTSWKDLDENETNNKNEQSL